MALKSRCRPTGGHSDGEEFAHRKNYGEVGIYGPVLKTSSISPIFIDQSDFSR